MEDNKKADYGQIFFSWHIPEFDKQERTRNWYIIAPGIALILLLFSMFNDNFLFAVIIVMAAFIYFLRENNDPEMINFQITDEGLVVGSKFYDYDEIKDFSIVYKPRYNIKNLYFEFKNVVKHRLTIPLADHNPLPIRENLLKYLPEDLERTDQPLSEALGKMFKL